MALTSPGRRRRRPGAPRFLARLRRGTQAAFSPGNTLALLKNGNDFFGELFAAIRRAEQSVYLEFYIVRADRTGQRLAELLLEAVGRGVRVCLLYDYIGSFDTPGTYFRRLERGGVLCRAFNPPPFRRGLAWFDRRNHRKIAVIDGTMAFAGGLNIGDEYTGSGNRPDRWRDGGIRLEGPAVGELRRLFCESWSGETGEFPDGCGGRVDPAPAGDARVLIVSGGPHQTRSRIRDAFRMAIAGATNSIRIITPYFVPGPRLIRALLRAARRGVRIQLVLPGRSDVPLVQLASRSSYAALLRGGIEIFEREETVLHAKVMLVDDCWAVVGSANLDPRSFHRNYEVNVIVDSHAFGEQVGAMFSEDLARSRRIDLAEHERRGWRVRLLEKLLEPVSWFL